MKAELLSVGSEILAGHITDTNATYLAQELAGLGVELGRVTQVGDSLRDICDVLESAIGRADIIVATGGIGPTPDDLTREAVAQVLGEQMVVQPELEVTLRAFFSGRGYEMPEANLKQATLIPSARDLPNRSGTAPGWWVERDARIVILLPGVPREMKTIWREEVVPRLKSRLTGAIVTHILKTSGLGESTVADQLGDLVHAETPTVATYAKADGVHVVVRAAAGDEDLGRRVVEEAVDEVRRILSDSIWGENADTLPGVVSALLEARNVTISTDESGSMGLIARQLSGAGSSLYLGGSVGNGRPPAADLTLRTDPASSSETGGVVRHECAVILRDGKDQLGRAVAWAASGDALAERATISALDLLRRRLAGLA